MQIFICDHFLSSSFYLMDSTLILLLHNRGTTYSQDAGWLVVTLEIGRAGHCTLKGRTTACERQDRFSVQECDKHRMPLNRENVILRFQLRRNVETYCQGGFSHMYQAILIHTHKHIHNTHPFALLPGFIHFLNMIVSVAATYTYLLGLLNEDVLWPLSYNCTSDVLSLLVLANSSLLLTILMFTPGTGVLFSETHLMWVWKHLFRPEHIQLAIFCSFQQASRQLHLDCT